MNKIPSPTLGIDLDGCVDEMPIFFNILTNHWPGKVVVITYRSDRSAAESDLQKYNIRYDELILVSTFDGKAEAVVASGALVYFDDQPEMIKRVPPGVNVMLVRNGGNFDFDEALWMLSGKTAKLV